MIKMTHLRTNEEIASKMIKLEDINGSGRPIIKSMKQLVILYCIYYDCGLKRANENQKADIEEILKWLINAND